jgi:hypothetical protein
MSQRNVTQRMLNGTQRNLRAWQTAEQKMKLRKFCGENPLLDFVHAVNDLYASLPEHQPGK